MITAAAYQPQPRGFEGVMLAASLNDVIQMECLSMSTRAVRVDCGGRTGRIFFAGGQVVHAEVGDLIGEDAFFEIVHWPKGSFQIEEGVRAIDETITHNWESLLMEAAQRHDERPPGTVTAFPITAQAMNTNHIAEVFKEPDILEAAHFSSDGQLIESKGGDPDALQGTAAYVTQLLAHIGTALGAEGLREVHLVGTQQRAVCVQSGESSTVAITTVKTNLTTLAKKLI